MARRGRYRIKLSQRARQDLDDILAWTIREFGEDAVLRYELLIAQAIKDLVSDPLRPGSRTLDETRVDGLRRYHLSSSRDRTPTPRVSRPRHFILYRVDGDTFAIVRVLHDARDLSQF